MENPHQRKKDPERIKQLILDSAIQLAAENGVQGMSIQSVATMAGITKGGVFHHFANKQILIKAMLEELINQLDREISTKIENDPVEYGCFTRAYIEVTLSSSVGLNSAWGALCMTVMTDKSFSEMWYQWLDHRLTQHVTTDQSFDLKILRYAADGAWFIEGLIPEPQEDYETIKQELLLRTYPKE
ncbi:TetR/AcrR family transcriptional regulator [Acinetobacter sp. P8-3-8]|uniref:TetR/AcrR family transcriptional regulator n=1 Tax=Acinetobacter sp. P8-3-8 TaxID=1029823 RepID=UPI0002486C3F|nr:TetR family transcriptional regulator [Acinetobacter sp. P8-3-8]